MGRMTTENKPKKPKLSLTKEEWIFLEYMVSHYFFNSQENASLNSNGDEEDVEHFNNNPHEISALEKLMYFIRELKPNKRAKLIPRKW